MIRIYGMSVGNGSYARVTRGVRGALDRLGLLDGFFPVDGFDDWGEYAGGDAPMAITIAPQTKQNVALASSVGDHDERAVLLPLNSSWAPRQMLEFAEPDERIEIPLVTRWLTPSQWSADQLQKLTDAPVTVWRHGLDEAFAPDPKLAEYRRESLNDGLRVLHLASTSRQRKGTDKLVEAWAWLHERHLLGRNPRLSLVVPEIPRPGDWLYQVLGAMPDSTKNTVFVNTPGNWAPTEMAKVIGSHHVVAQPSRGEGFGMVPLEALACGVPVVATTCTGHSEYLKPGMPGLSAVPHGSDRAIDDGPNAMAPGVSSDDVAGALVKAWGSWVWLQEGALDNAEALRKKWSWDAVMYEWVAREGWSGP